LIDTPAARTSDVETIAARASAALAIGRKNFTPASRLQELVTSFAVAGRRWWVPC
jgi:hypothetical protein